MAYVTTLSVPERRVVREKGCGSTQRWYEGGEGRKRERERDRGGPSSSICMRTTLIGLYWFVYVTIFIAAANDITRTGNNQSVYTDAFFVV